MTYLLRVLFVCSLFAAIAIPAFHPRSGVAAESPRVVEQRSIEIPDSRIIAISPDGSAIAASSFDMERLCIYERDTRAERTCADMAPLEAALRIEDVVWSPDNSKLVLGERALERFVDGDLWVMDATTGVLTNLTDDGVNARLPFGDQEAEFDQVFVDVNPTWLPDGSGVTFSRSTWRDGEWRGNTIETVPVTGGEPEVLTTITTEEPGAVYFGMRWTADASTLFYTVAHRESDDPDNGIWRINANGTSAEKLVGRDVELGTVALAGLSPGGETVLAHYAWTDSITPPYRYALLDVASGELTPLPLQHPVMPELSVAWPAVLAPDGQHVVYVNRFSNPEFQLLIAPVDGGDEVVLTPDGLPGAVPISLTSALTWTTDGTLLINQSSPSAATLLTIEGVTEDASAATPIPNDELLVSPSVEPMSDELASGTTVTVNDNDVPLRSAPSIDAQTVAVLASGTVLTLVGPAVEGDGVTWIPVTELASGTIGYVRSEFINSIED